MRTNTGVTYTVQLTDGVEDSFISRVESKGRPTFATV